MVLIWGVLIPLGFLLLGVRIRVPIGVGFRVLGFRVQGSEYVRQCVERPERVSKLGFYVKP